MSGCNPRTLIDFGYFAVVHPDYRDAVLARLKSGDLVSFVVYNIGAPGTTVVTLQVQ